MQPKNPPVIVLVSDATMIFSFFNQFFALNSTRHYRYRERKRGKGTIVMILFFDNFQFILTVLTFPAETHDLGFFNAFLQSHPSSLGVGGKNARAFCDF